MRVFYVIYIREEPLRTCLNAIRALADPTTTHPAHITVRGPYRQRYDVRRASLLVQRQPVLLYEVGYFLRHGQHTVLLDAFSDELDRAWQKPDVGFAPHVTLYDGQSRIEAVELYQLVTRFPLRLRFSAVGLEPLVSGKPLANIRDWIDYSLLNSITGANVASTNLYEPDRLKRLQLIERLCRHLSSNSLKPQDPLVQLASHHRLNRPVTLPGGWADARGSRGLAPPPTLPEDPFETWEFLPSHSDISG